MSSELLKFKTLLKRSDKPKIFIRQEKENQKWHKGSFQRRNQLIHTLRNSNELHVSSKQLKQRARRRSMANLHQQWCMTNFEPLNSSKNSSRLVHNSSNISENIEKILNSGLQTKQLRQSLAQQEFKLTQNIESLRQISNINYDRHVQRVRKRRSYQHFSKLNERPEYKKQEIKAIILDWKQEMKRLVIQFYINMGGKNSKRQLEETIFQMRLASKQFAKQSQRSQKEEKVELEKAKQNLSKGLIENAQIHAENAIRKKNESQNYLRLSSKMDAVVSRIQTASRTEDITGQFARVIPQMNRVLQNMNVQSVSQTMNQFEKMFEDIDVTTGYINESLNQTTASTTPQEQVNGLLQEIASLNNIEVGNQLGVSPMQNQNQQVQSDDLEERLNRLR